MITVKKIFNKLLGNEMPAKDQTVNNYNILDAKRIHDHRGMEVGRGACSDDGTISLFINSDVKILKSDVILWSGSKYSKCFIFIDKVHNVSGNKFQIVGKNLVYKDLTKEHWERISKNIISERQHANRGGLLSDRPL